ncbi:MAG: peptide chain release factor N(5)-glutamine methyltransferase [Acidobacteriaceae bacterium]|jgi:release factor glutamine methyltransferase
MTLREALTRATRQLDASSGLCADAARDAALLLRHVLAISHAAQLAEPERELTTEQQATFDALILRRIANEPIQYITGEQEFFGLTLRVTPAVLIPRPETEQLVEAVLAEMNSAELDRTQPLRILDVGTGSGAIAIALAFHLPHAQITAVDLSAAALEVAAANTARHALAGRIRFVQSDLLDGIRTVILSEAAHVVSSEVEGPAVLPVALPPFDVIVSNPPYVPTADRASLHPQVRDHEPAAALFAGLDGLDIYRRLIPQARAALQPNGLLALEIGHGQREAIASLLSGWNELRFLDDLQHIPRIALARKP